MSTLLDIEKLSVRFPTSRGSKKTHTSNVGRTLRPDGQTEPADIVDGKCALHPTQYMPV